MRRALDLAAEAAEAGEDFTTGEGLRALLNRLHEAGEGTWASDPLARELMAICVADATAAGFTHIRLGTPRDHLRARRFYEREGWTTDGVPLPDDSLGLVLIEYRRALAGSGSRATA